jgi:hypothetical protein
VRFDGFDVAALVSASRGDELSADVAWPDRRKGGVQMSGRLFPRDAEQSLDFVALGRATFADALVVFADNLGGALDLLRLALDFEVAAVPQMSRNP